MAVLAGGAWRDGVVVAGPADPVGPERNFCRNLTDIRTALAKERRLIGIGQDYRRALVAV
jgi:hypothetical protein